MRARDYMYPGDWGWHRMRAQAAWGCLERKTTVVVAVVDSGVADNHPDLRPYLLDPLTVIGETRDDDDHGTLVAGTIAGASPGIIRPEVIRIRSVKFCSQQVVPSADLGARAIHASLDSEPRPSVIVLAWDVGYNTPALEQAMSRARDADAVVVAAAGNHGTDNDRFPNWPAHYGSSPHVITVMASDRYDERASFSCYGRTTVHVAAPGVEILSTVPSIGTPNRASDFPAGYRLHGGTSAAAAHVASLVALIRAKNPGWTAQQVKAHTCNSAVRIDALAGRCKSGGIVDFESAICSGYSAA